MSTTGPSPGVKHRSAQRGGAPASARRTPPTALWSRQLPKVTEPVRHAGAAYHTEEKEEKNGGAIPGVPLSSANAAVVAAVRLAYQVAEDQIERSSRLARRLRDAADQQVGPHSDRKAIDATERLVMGAMMSGLEWWESSVAQGRCPVKRLAAAEYQMVGTILGLGPKGQKPAADRSAPQDTAQSRDRPREAPSVATTAADNAQQLLIVYSNAREQRRPVELVHWEITPTGALQTSVFFFHGASAPGARGVPLQAELAVDAAAGVPARLTIAPPPDAPGGHWKGAICDDTGVQRGIIEIALT